MSEQEERTVREHLHEAVQETIGMGDEMPEGSMLKGWVVLAEWVSPDNGAWITRLSGNPAGDGLAVWAEEGLLHYALHNWTEEPEDED